MFQAVLHSKVRTNFVAPQLGGDLRSFYRQTEDFLTAAVFSRLAYLPAQFLWSVLRGATASSCLPLPDDAGDLLDCEFWPRWKFRSGQAEFIKEPDVLLRFERLALLVEAKGSDEHSQNPNQWAAEIAAYHGSDQNSGSEPVYLLAIGGLGEEPSPSGLLALQTEAQHLLARDYDCAGKEARIVACSWRRLLVSVRQSTSLIDARADAAPAFILRDLLEILRFHGFRYTRWLGDLSLFPVSPLRDIAKSSADVLSRWGQPDRSGTSLFFSLGRYPIRAEAISALGRMQNDHSTRS